MTRKMKIGVFDSGLGGLIILRALRESLLAYDYVYFGDTANLPYGSKSEDEIQILTQKGIERLFNEGAAIVIVACNTASAESVRALQDSLLNKEEWSDRKILGVIIPTIEYIDEHALKRVLLIGTERTVASEKYSRELRLRAPEVSLIERATPDLARMIELSEMGGAVRCAAEVIMRERGIEAVVLACTHYAAIKAELREMFPDLLIVSQDEVIPEKLKRYLEKHPEIESRISLTAAVSIFESGTERPHSHYKQELMSHLI